MSEYRLQWRRETSAPRPEEQYDGTRQDAVEKQLSEIEEIDPDDVEYSPPPRHLSGGPTEFYQVCELVVQTVPQYIALYKMLSSDDQNEVELSDPDVIDQERDDE